MNWKRLATAFVLPALVVTALPQEAAAKKCAVKAFHLQNNGGYVVTNLAVNWRGDGRDPRKGKVTLLTTEKVDLTKSELADGGLQKGDEVWLEYSINKGWWGKQATRSCRKDGTQLVYDPDLGTTWFYYARGTTQDDNRCQFGNNDCKNPNAEPR